MYSVSRQEDYRVFSVFVKFCFDKLQSLTSPQLPPWGQKKVAVVERFKQESVFGLSTKKVAFSGDSTVIHL